jgi:hypothetical protein
MVKTTTPLRLSLLGGLVVVESIQQTRVDETCFQKTYTSLWSVFTLASIDSTLSSSFVLSSHLSKTKLFWFNLLDNILELVETF